MKSLDHYDLDELKLIYLTLHAALPDNPQLMDSELLQALQIHLQQLANSANVDVSHHGQWAHWLNTGDVLKRV